MRRTIAWTAGALTVVHGLIHLLGAVEGFGWADVEQLDEPISVAMGAAWLVAGLLVVAVGFLMPARAPGWWVMAGIAAVVSQAVIATSWDDANAGTAANVLLAVAAAWGFLADGPPSLRAQYRRTVADADAGRLAGGAIRYGSVTEGDLADLPSPVAAFVRATGAVGRPRVVGFRASIHGRIRNDPDDAWMTFTGTQVNVFGAEPSRVFFMDATMKGLPVDVLHTYVGSEARMEVRAASVVRVVDLRGPDMTRAETVTLLDDLCVFAPAAIVGAPIAWAAIDDHHARATYANAGHTITAELTFDDEHRLVDFVSDDRLARAGSTFSPQRWSTPISAHRSFEGRWAAAVAAGCWHPTDAPSFDYVELHVDDITYWEVP